jgi:hypothetical protein
MPSGDATIQNKFAGVTPRNFNPMLALGLSAEARKAVNAAARWHSSHSRTTNMFKSEFLAHTGDPAPFFASELRQRCGRLFEVKNRPRANPVRGVGGGDQDRGIELRWRCWMPDAGRDDSRLYCATKC